MGQYKCVVPIIEHATLTPVCVGKLEISSELKSPYSYRNNYSNTIYIANFNITNSSGNDIFSIAQQFGDLFLNV